MGNGVLYIVHGFGVVSLWWFVYIDWLGKKR